MVGFDTLSDFVNQEADYNFASGLEHLKKIGGQVLDATNPFSSQVSEPLNQNIQSFAKFVNESPVGKVAAQGAQAMTETGVDYGIPMAPVGAMWKTTNNFLKKLSPEHYNNLTSVDRKALETLTETYPSVTKAPLRYDMEDAYGIDKLRSIPEHLSGEKPGYIMLADPQNYISHPLEKALSSPAISYAHEGGHALTGSTSDLENWLTHTPWQGQTGASAEGFAEGFAHSLMGKYNKEVLAPYWQHYKNDAPDLKNIYLHSGYHGVDVGDAIRSGQTPDQLGVIQRLLDILKRGH